MPSILEVTLKKIRAIMAGQKRREEWFYISFCTGTDTVFTHSAFQITAQLLPLFIFGTPKDSESGGTTVTFASPERTGNESIPGTPGPAKHIQHQLQTGEEMQLPDIELVSAKVHEAWIASKLKQNVTSRTAEDGEELMVPYDQLSEKAKELDRGTVRAVYAAIRAAL